MQRKTFLYTLIFCIFTLTATLLSAQPGGPGGPPPGGRPQGNFPGGRPGNWDRNMQDAQNRSQQVKQKKVRSGSTFKVVGTLIDSAKNEPLIYCNVTVLEREDSTFVKGATTNQYGYFEVTEVPAGEYFLRVSYIGYTTRFIPITVENNTALGNINMKAGAQTMRAVKVTAQRPLYAMDGEKMVYNVADDPSIQTGTTNDALQNAPGVEVDVEGNITLRGVSSVEIWINDKPSKLTEENLKTYLETLPANALDRIEAITNPSAKYATDAEAVINIVTTAHVKSNQFVSFGVNGSNQPNFSPWISYMWAKEKLSINIFGSGRFSQRKNTSSSWAVSRTDGTGGNAYDTLMKQTDTSFGYSRNWGANLFANVNYEIDSSSDIEFHGMVNGNWGRSVSNDSVARLFYPLALDSTWIYSTLDSSRSSRYFGNIGVDYTKKFDNEGHNLRLGLSGHLSNNASNEWYNRDYTTYTNLNEDRFRLTEQNSQSFDAYARYNRPYSKQGEMSYGINADYSNSNNSYNRYFKSASGNYDSVDQLRDYHFSGIDNSIGGDVNWTHRWGNFTLSSGLGITHSYISWDYDTDMPFADSNSDSRLSFRPSIHLTYRTESMHNFKLNYSMRMSHPGETQLTQFRFYGNDSYSSGNPNPLKPAITHNAEAGWTKFTQFGNFGIEGYGRLSANEISSLTDSKTDEYLDRIVSYSIPYNLGSSYRYGASFNMTYRPSGFLNVRLYTNVYNYGYSMDYMRNGTMQHIDTSKVSFSTRINAWAKLWNQYQFHLSFNYTSPTIGLLSQSKARVWFNMGVRSDFFKRKLSVFVNIQDLFNWGKRIGTGSENTNPYYLTNATNRVLNSRYISAGITLRFGKMELERQAQTISEITEE